MKTKPPKMVHVSWIDSIGSSGWQTTHEDADLTCESVGFLADKNDKRVKIYMNKSAYQRGDIMEIPLVAVKRVRYLK